MRKINTIITHMGADSRKLTLSEMKRIYQDTHYNSLYKAYNQPRSNNKDFPDIAYHFIIGTDGWEQVREYDTYSYHASNLKVNKESVAVCLTGNYDRDTLSPEMEKSYYEVLTKIQKDLPSIVKNEPHRKYASKSCPGKNITDEFLVKAFQETSTTPIDPAGEEDTDLEARVAKLEDNVVNLVKLNKALVTVVMKQHE